MCEAGQGERAFDKCKLKTLSESLVESEQALLASPWREADKSLCATCGERQPKFCLMLAL